MLLWKCVVRINAFSFKSYFQIFQIELLSIFNADALFTKQFYGIPSLDLLGSRDYQGCSVFWNMGAPVWCWVITP